MNQLQVRRVRTWLVWVCSCTRTLTCRSPRFTNDGAQPGTMPHAMGHATPRCNSSFAAEAKKEDGARLAACAICAGNGLANSTSALIGRQHEGVVHLQCQPPTQLTLNSCCRCSLRPHEQAPSPLEHAPVHALQLRLLRNEFQTKVH